MALHSDCRSVTVTPGRSLAVLRRKDGHRFGVSRRGSDVVVTCLTWTTERPVPWPSEGEIGDAIDCDVALVPGDSTPNPVALYRVTL